MTGFNSKRKMAQDKAEIEQAKQTEEAPQSNGGGWRLPDFGAAVAGEAAGCSGAAAGGASAGLLASSALACSPRSADASRAIASPAISVSERTMRAA